MSHDEDLNRLLEQVRLGDDEALEALLARVQPKLYRFSMKMCRHSADAEDVLQESMLAIARSVRSFRGDSSVSTWLFKVTRSFCIKKRRHKKLEPERSESLDDLRRRAPAELTSSDPDPLEQAETGELWRQVHEAVQRLDPAHKEIVLLRDIEGLRAKEVAEIIGISVGAVKSRLHRARRELRDLVLSAPHEPQSGCPDIRQMYSMHLEGDLSADLCSSMEAHVQGCARCAQECEGLKETLEACSAAPDRVPTAVQQRVKRALGRLLRSSQR